LEVIFNIMIQLMVEFHIFQVNSAMAIIEETPLKEFTETDWSRMEYLGFLRRGMYSFKGQHYNF